MKLLRILGIKPDHFRGSKQLIELAFTVDGVDYYQHTDVFNMPFRRALKALTYGNELAMKCDEAYLKQWVAKLDSYFEKSRLKVDDLVEMKTLLAQLKERMVVAFVPDHVYKVASVRFFDKNEDPCDYDFAYNQKKIARWKKAEAAADFFLREPIVRLLPLLAASPTDLPHYIATVEAMTAAHSAYLSVTPLQSPKMA